MLLSCNSPGFSGSDLAFTGLSDFFMDSPHSEPLFVLITYAHGQVKSGHFLKKDMYFENILLVFSEKSCKPLWPACITKGTYRNEVLVYP